MLYLASYYQGIAKIDREPGEVDTIVKKKETSTSLNNENNQLGRFFSDAVDIITDSGEVKYDKNLKTNPYLSA